MQHIKYVIVAEPRSAACSGLYLCKLNIWYLSIFLPRHCRYSKAEPLQCHMQCVCAKGGPSGPVIVAGSTPLCMTVCGAARAAVAGAALGGTSVPTPRSAHCPEVVVVLD